MVELDARVSDAALAGEIANFRLSGPGDLQLKRCFMPQLVAILQCRGRQVRLECGVDLFRIHKTLKKALVI